MFDAIAPTYDLLNRLLSFGVDRSWRRTLINSLGPLQGLRVLDVACGTGDLLISMARAQPSGLVGVDISPGMLRSAERRLKARNVDAPLVAGAVEALPFGDCSFDVVTVAFGIRNFEDLEAGLKEMRRILRPGGHVRILEFSRPRPGVWGSVFGWYFSAVVPTVGRWISGHPEAYTYLPASVASFPDAQTLASILRRSGLTVRESVSLTGGIATLTVAVRPFSDVPET